MEISCLQYARSALLDPAELTDHHLQTIMHTLTGSEVNYADLYFQLTYSESWALEDSILKIGHFAIDHGVGVRVMSGEKTGLSYSQDIHFSALKKASAAARGIVRSGGEQSVSIHHTAVSDQPTMCSTHNPLYSLSNEKKIALIQKVDRYIREKDSRVIQVSVRLSGEHETILVMTNTGSLVADVRPLVRFNVAVVLESQGRRESGCAGGGGRLDYAHFLTETLLLQYADAALHQANVNLEAIAAPAGTMAVILGPGWPGVLLHEAVGHGLEGDFNYKGISVYSGRLGEQVASSLCTIVDNGTLLTKRGSMNVDDEGTPTQCNVLIENGKLCHYLLDKRNAYLLGQQSTGNGRRESYAHLTIPRMTNTYLLSGSSIPADIIASVKYGLYAVNFSGGQVDITSGQFVFSTSEAYLVEEGKITAPVKGAMLVGNGPEVLTKISMIGNDLQLDPGVGSCGKEGQTVPVSVGQPTLKIDELIVGGTRI